jgi:vitamin B12 transporter
MKKILISGLFVGAAFAPGWAFAQDQEADPANIVVVARRIEQLPESMLKVPITISVQRAIDDIAMRQPQTVTDMLATIPGVTVSRNGGVGGFSAVRIRGAEGEQTLTLIDGVRVNDPSSPGGGYDFGNLLIGNIDTVNVYRGPNSVAWGSQAIGGVVDIHTYSPLTVLNGVVQGEYGYHHNATLSARLSDTVGPVSFGLGGGFFTDDGISSAASGIERDGFRQYAANGKVSVELAKRVSLDFRGFYTKGRAEIDGFPPPTFDFADTAEFSKSQQVTGYVGLNADLPDDKLNNRIAFTLSDINRDNFDPAFGSAPSFIGRGRSERFEYAGRAKFSDSISADFGLEHERSRFNDGFTFAKTHLTSGFGQLIVKPAEMLTLTGGARLDDHQSFGSRTTLGATIELRPSDNTLITANYGEGFKAPTLYQLFGPFGDVTLRPETSTGFDVGVTQTLLDRKLKLIMSYFWRRSRNQIDFDLNSFTYGNIARSRAQGIEMRAEFRPTDHLSMVANFTITDSEGKSDTTSPFARLLRRPKYSFSTSADWHVTQKLGLSATLLMVSHSLDGFGGSTRLDGYALVSTRASWKFNDTIEVFGRVDNLLDERYQTVAGYGSYGRTAHIGARVSF